MESDQFFAVAEDIFFELAGENLSEEKMQCLHAHASAFYIEAPESFSDWSAMLYSEVDPEEYVELWFFVESAASGSKDCQKVHLAKMLLSLDDDDKDCHIDWI